MDSQAMISRYEKLMIRAQTAGMISEPPSDEYRELCYLAMALNRPIRWSYRVVRLYGDPARNPAGVR